MIRLGSWSEFLSMTADSPYHNWAFRGQRDASLPLYNAVSRYLMTYGIDPQSWPHQEERILRIFKRKAIHFLEHIPDLADDFQWLALMQDHGAPTRLLDFSWSPYVAAFFALHNATEDAIIWACNPFEIERNKKALKAQKIKDRIIPIARRLLGEHLQNKYEDFYDIKLINGEMVGTIFSHLGEWNKAFDKKLEKQHT